MISHQASVEILTPSVVLYGVKAAEAAFGIDTKNTSIYDSDESDAELNECQLLKEFIS